MKRTSNPEETAILISKKAYNDFSTRIRETLDAVSICSESIDEALALFDHYAKGEISDLDSTDIMVKLALMMLKPEIDKAIRRSSAARERAKLRREKYAPVLESHKNASCSENFENSENTENSKLIERPMNRRERREYEHELAREQRRYERRLKRMKGRDLASGAGHNCA